MWLLTLENRRLSCFLILSSKQAFSKLLNIIHLRSVLSILNTLPFTGVLYLTCVQGTKINLLSYSLIRCQSLLKGLRIELLNYFFLLQVIYESWQQLVERTLPGITVLISPLSIMLSISLLQEFTFGQLIHQPSIFPHPGNVQQTKLRCTEASQD